MKYKDILGYSKPKKKVIKEEVHKPTITEELIGEFGPLTERKLDAKHIATIQQQTDKNNHTMARQTIAFYLGNSKFTKFYQAMEKMNDVFGGYGPELSKLNQKMEKQLYKDIKRKFKNAKEIIGAL